MKILELPLEITHEELLDRLDITIKELAYNMQKTTPRYQIRKAKTGNIEQQIPPATSSNAVLHSLPITSSACDDNGLIKFFMVTLWVRDVCFQKTLLDGGSLVVLINRKLVMKMRPRPRNFIDSRIKVSLANDSITESSEYVNIPVNVQGVEGSKQLYGPG